MTPTPLDAAADRLRDAHAYAAPSSWLVENATLVPSGARVLDVACGRGRHALLLAAAGCRVTALDVDPSKVSGIRAAATSLALDLTARVTDLEAGSADLGSGDYDVVLVFNYLYRPLFPSLTAALRPGGLLLYETFIAEQALRGRPRNPAFLLERGELRRLVRPLVVRRAREGEFDGKMISSVAALREAPA
jgi:SAM-dependent methyltransferase